MALGSTQPLTEMSTRNLPGWVKGGRGIRLTNSPLSVSRSSRSCESLDVSQQYGSSRPVIKIVLPLPEMDGCSAVKLNKLHRTRWECFYTEPWSAPYPVFTLRILAPSVPYCNISRGHSYLMLVVTILMYV
jgi:hypothetical protein